MYITINNIMGKKIIDLSYPIHSNKEVTVNKVLSDNVQYEIVKSHEIMDDISPGKGKLILNKTYSTRELLSILEGMAAFSHFVDDDEVIKINRLMGITEMTLNLDELDNTDNLEDGRPSNGLITDHVTVNEDFTQLVTYEPQYKRLKNGKFTSLTLRIMDQKSNIITDGQPVTVVLHIHDCEL